LITEKVLQNGGEIQDGRQTRMCHNSISVHLNHLKLRIWKHQFIKNNGVEVIFSKLQNDGVIQNGATSHCFILSVLAKPFLNRFYYINPFWTCNIKHFYIPQAQNNSIQNEVNIQDGDLTFMHPFV
jgi:hypothetical protein